MDAASTSTYQACQNICSPYTSAISSERDDLNAKDDDMTFCMSNYAKEALKMMFMMRSHNMLTDVILEVKHELFPAHKVVLSAASPYFKAMFTGGLKESEMSRIKLQGVSITHFHINIKFNLNLQLISYIILSFKSSYVSGIRNF